MSAGRARPGRRDPAGAQVRRRRTNGTNSVNTPNPRGDAAVPEQPAQPARWHVSSGSLLGTQLARCALQRAFEWVPATNGASASIP